jgi:hypothetical protein
MAGAISQDRQSCQFLFLLDEKPTVVPVGAAGEGSGGDDLQGTDAIERCSMSIIDQCHPQQAFITATALFFAPSFLTLLCGSDEKVTFDGRKTAFVEGRNGQFGAGLN